MGKMDRLEKKEQNRIRRKRAMRLILVILVIHIILNLIQFPLVHEQQITGNLILNSSFEQEEKETQRQCFRKYYQWDYEWEGYNDFGAAFVSPKFRLYNNENRKGTYYVEFGFFDQGKYDFNQYRNKEYELVRDELPWHFASMHSENITVVIGPNEDRLVTSMSQKVDGSSQYWVYALVTEPSYVKCETKVVSNNSGGSQNKAKLKLPYIEETETEYITAWDWLIGKL